MIATAYFSSFARSSPFTISTTMHTTNGLQLFRWGPKRCFEFTGALEMTGDDGGTHAGEAVLPRTGTIQCLPGSGSGLCVWLILHKCLLLLHRRADA